jgi:signal transduction histidine kinase
MIEKSYFKILTKRQHRQSIIITLSVLIFMFGSLGVESFYSYKNERQKIENQVTNLSLVLEEHLNSSFDIISVVLGNLQDTFLTEFRDRNSLSVSYIKLFVKSAFAHTRDIIAIRVYDKKGDLITDTQDSHKKVNVYDREYFQEVLHSEINHMAVSKPILSRVTNEWVVVFAKKLIDNKGEFFGVAICTIDLDQFYKIFRSLNVGENGVISLKDFNQIHYARIPEVENFIGKAIPGFDLTKDKYKFTSNFTYNNYSPIDRIKRIISRRKLTNYDFVVSVGVSIDDALREFRFRTYLHFLVLIIFSLTVLIFVLRSLSTRELLDEQKKQALHSAKLSSLGEMAAGIAHEINNPLTVIQGSVSNLKKYRDLDRVANSENEQKAFERITRNVQRISRIISGLRNFSRDSFDDPFASIKISTLIDECLDLSVERFKSVGIELEVKISNPDEIIFCREIQICQVIINLLNNSFDAIKNENEKWVVLETISHHGTLEISVTDSGKGISNEIAEKIMEPFFTTKEIGKGTGIGLSISRGIIESHHGKFYLDKKNKNTKFVIIIPKDQNSQA